RGGVAYARRVDAHVGAQLRAERQVLVGPHDRRVPPGHLARAAGADPAAVAARGRRRLPARLSSPISRRLFRPMTYCVAIEVNDGLVFAADTRTSGSFDDVRVYKKLHVYEWPGDRVFVILSSGNLATTQLMNWRLKRDADDPNAPRSLRTFKHLY